jgi:PAS domain S-box-containing protein
MSADPILSSLAPTTSWQRTHSREHFVQFYEQDKTLLEAVQGFIGEALTAGTAAVVIATRAHLDVLEGYWCAEGIDLEGARKRGQYVALDAQETLSKLLVDGRPQARCFREIIEPVVARAEARFPRVVAFGEMVALLWQAQRYGAAIQLEMLWNELAREHHFALFCAYPITDERNAPVDALHEVCSQHETAIPTEAYASLATPKERLAEICNLQSRARRLQQEVEHRKRMERQLAIREQELTDFLEHGAHPLHKVGADGTILWANRAELDMLGYRREEFVGRHIADFHVDAETIQSILSRLLAGQTLRDEPARLRCRDGRVLNVLINSNGLWEDGKFLHTRCFTRDVTREMQMRESLRHRETVLRENQAQLMSEAAALGKLNELSSKLWRATTLQDGLENMLDALIELVSADKGNIQLLDPASQVLTIVTQRGFEPDFLHFFLEVSTADNSACGRALRSGERIVIEDVDTDEPYAPLREVARAADYRAVISTPLVGADGAPLGMASTHFRMPHRPSEQELRRLDLYLRQASDFIQRCRTEHALRESQEALREADRRKDEFLAVLAHELRNPLAPIRFAVSAAKKQGRTPEQARRAEEIIERQVSHMNRLLDDLLDVSRITRGTLELKSSHTELTAIVGAAIEAARPVIDDKRHTLSLDLPRDSVRIKADSVRLAQVFSNLLINAAKYTDPGGHIALTVTHEGRSVVFSVRDDGIGIAPEMMPRLFTMFSQAQNAVARSEGGLGIGLALVQGLVKLHGGSIEAHSEGVNRGSTFIVRLPIVPEASPAMTSSAEEPATRGSSLRVLVVDDNRDGATTSAMFLELCGHRVQAVYSAREALEVAEAFRPHVALLDIGMPEMDGYELAARIRAEAWGERITLIAATGWGQERDRKRAAAAGFDHHLTKPVDPAVLEPLLHDIARQNQHV